MFHKYPTKEAFSELSSSDIRKKKITGGDATMIWTIVNFIWKEIEKQGFSIDRNAIPDIDTNHPPYIFIIDEINRGEISKIFGELFFAIEPGYRGNTEMKMKTQYQNLISDNNDPFNEGFYVPKNVYILATMNDIDRSVESMDFAIRRRFAWKEVLAEENTGMLNYLDDDLREKALRVMSALNKEIGEIEGLGTSFHIGASYFLKLNDYDTDKFKNLWDYHLKGLLHEYLRGLDQSDDPLGKLEKTYYGAIEESNKAEG